MSGTVSDISVGVGYLHNVACSLQMFTSQINAMIGAGMVEQILRFCESASTISHVRAL